MKNKSKVLKNFVEEITYKNRNPENIRALELLNDIDSNPTIILPKDSLLYRARIVKKSDENKIGKEPGYFGFNAKGSFVTPVENTKDMRANYRYIPYLYCANHAYLSVVEVRPRLGTKVSIASIKVLQEIKLLDFTATGKSNKRMTDTKENLLNDISAMFATPVTEEDDIVDYIPTQFIAEYAKKLHYDGIAYSSSLVPEMTKSGLPYYNIVIFNYDKTEVVKSNLMRVKENYLEIEKIDRDEDPIDVENFISKLIGDYIETVEKIIFDKND